MLSTSPNSSRTAQRPGAGKRTRTLQRRLHLISGLVIAVVIYVEPAYDSAVATAVRWLLLPLLVLSGVAMWQWPRLRRLARSRAAGA